MTSEETWPLPQWRRDELVENIESVLDKYDIDYNDIGIEKNLRAWEKNKGPLIKTLSAHPQWDWGKLAVVMDMVKNDGKISHEEVQDRKCYLILMATNHLPKDRVGSLSTALNAVLENPESVLGSAEVAARASEAAGIKIVPGMKTSRVVNSVCKHFGLDTHTWYNYTFAKLADSLNPTPIETTAIVSVHPCDYLEMSNGKHWDSCHRLFETERGPIGEYCAGTLSYMNDGVTMIFYTLPCGDKPHLWKYPKVDRQVFCYRDGLLFQSALYSANEWGMSPHYRHAVQGVIAEALGEPNRWVLSTDHDDIRPRLDSHSEAMHYDDYGHATKGVTLSTLRGSGGRIIIIGHTAHCLKCGDSITKSGSMFCPRHDHSSVCAGCQESIGDDDYSQYVDGSLYCGNCACSCARCDEPILYDDSYTVRSERGFTQTVCESCYDELYRACDCCGDYYLEDSMHETKHDVVCSDCLLNKYLDCCQCGEIYIIPHLFPHDTGDYCPTCKKECFYECPDCGDTIHEDEECPRCVTTWDNPLHEEGGHIDWNRNAQNHTDFDTDRTEEGPARASA